MIPDFSVVEQLARLSYNLAHFSPEKAVASAFRTFCAPLDYLKSCKSSVPIS